MLLLDPAQMWQSMSTNTHTHTHTHTHTTERETELELVGRRVCMARSNSARSGKKLFFWCMATEKADTVDVEQQDKKSCQKMTQAIQYTHAHCTPLHTTAAASHPFLVGAADKQRVSVQAVGSNPAQISAQTALTRASRHRLSFSSVLAFSSNHILVSILHHHRIPHKLFSTPSHPSRRGSRHHSSHRYSSCPTTFLHPASTTTPSYPRLSQ